ncbi:hypothetical protein OG625_00765 [Streptomyces sp. NBC_01351]|uniref:hypothetical protein n=1 Tax=Streptomyces sp. NBC_01351 TaxID=2903833 RepID=UPI002E2EA8AE|nr:hypothetical protein [Streptomyces sp. NBC_01351]
MTRSDLVDMLGAIAESEDNIARREFLDAFPEDFGLLDEQSAQEVARPIMMTGVCRHHAPVSTIVKFFVAPDDEKAALVVGAGPGPAFECLSLGNFDVEEAVIEWECLFFGGSFEELLGAGEPRIVADEDDDGCIVFAFSDRLVDALATAEPSRLHEIAVAWARQREEDGEDIAPAVAGEMVEGLGTLARGRADHDHGLYCWVA